MISGLEKNGLGEFEPVTHNPSPSDHSVCNSESHFFHEFLHTAYMQIINISWARHVCAPIRLRLHLINH